MSGGPYLRRRCITMIHPPGELRMFLSVRAVSGGDSLPVSICVDARVWCRRVRRAGLSRSWDVLFPPEQLYADNSSFDVGQERTFVLVSIGSLDVAAYVLAMRGSDCCLVDVRSREDADQAWCDVLFQHWHDHAVAAGAASMTGPVGAFAFITDGVPVGPPDVESVHIAQYPRILVDGFRQHGYVHAWSGTVWGRRGASGTSARSMKGASPSVRRETWMTIIPTLRTLESVLSTSFATLPWHRGSGADLSSLARRFMLVGHPSLMITGSADGKPAGAILMYRDISSVPERVHRLPSMMRDLWLFFAARRSRLVHVSLIGIVPERRSSRLSADLFDAAAAVLNQAQRVTTSWIRDDNMASKMMSKRAGLEPLEQRFVFRKHLPTLSINYGERE